ncbi:MAG: ribonuclease HII [Patescibacteria group bacterium]
MIIVGIDEVGRGCWAGPVVAGAVALDSDFEVPAKANWKLGDSKVLSKKQREAADEGLRLMGAPIGLGWVDAADVDKVGITTAVKLAMQRALEQIQTDYDEVIIDGHLNFLEDKPKTRALIKADATQPAVSAASIVAKVARDNYMAEITAQYPHYGFEKHVGYGTALHLEKLKLHGITELHRKSFKPIKAMI